MNRRRYLETAIVTVTTGTLAGCSGGGGGNGGGSNGGSTTGGSGGGAATTGGGEAATTGGAGQMTGTSEGSTMTGGQPTTGGGGMTTGGGTAAVRAVSNDEYGDILVDADGYSLYLFEKDSNGNSTCQGACAKAWPPLTVEGKPTKGSGVTARIGTTSREDGSTQVTVANHPLYRYAPDTKPGQTKGQELKQFGAEWYLLAPDGSKVEGEGGEGGGGGSTTAAGSGSGSGSGY